MSKFEIVSSDEDDSIWAYTSQSKKIKLTQSQNYTAIKSESENIQQGSNSAKEGTKKLLRQDSGVCFNSLPVRVTKSLDDSQDDFKSCITYSQHVKKEAKNPTKCQSIKKEIGSNVKFPKRKAKTSGGSRKKKKVKVHEQETPNAKIIRSGRCRVCQFPFAALSKVETPTWHEEICLNIPYASKDQCPSGVLCTSTIVSHYKKLRHTALSRSQHKYDQARVIKGEVQNAKVKLEFDNEPREVRNISTPIDTDCTIEVCSSPESSHSYSDTKSSQTFSHMSQNDSATSPKLSQKGDATLSKNAVNKLKKFSVLTMLRQNASKLKKPVLQESSTESNINCSIEMEENKHNSMHDITTSIFTKTSSSNKLTCEKQFDNVGHDDYDYDYCITSPKPKLNFGNDDHNEGVNSEEVMTKVNPNDLYIGESSNSVQDVNDITDDSRDLSEMLKDMYEEANGGTQVPRKPKELVNIGATVSDVESDSSDDTDILLTCYSGSVDTKSSRATKINKSSGAMKMTKSIGSVAVKITQSSGATKTTQSSGATKTKQSSGATKTKQSSGPTKMTQSNSATKMTQSSSAAKHTQSNNSIKTFQSNTNSVPNNIECNKVMTDSQANHCLTKSNSTRNCKGAVDKRTSDSRTIPAGISGVALQEENNSCSRDSAKGFFARKLEESKNQMKSFRSVDAGTLTQWLHRKEITDDKDPALIDDMFGDEVTAEISKTNTENTEESSLFFGKAEDQSPQEVTTVIFDNESHTVTKKSHKGKLKLSQKQRKDQKLKNFVKMEIEQMQLDGLGRITMLTDSSEDEFTNTGAKSNRSKDTTSVSKPVQSSEKGVKLDGESKLCTSTGDKATKDSSCTETPSNSSNSNTIGISKFVKSKGVKQDKISPPHTEYKATTDNMCYPIQQGSPFVSQTKPWSRTLSICSQNSPKYINNVRTVDPDSSLAGGFFQDDFPDTEMHNFDECQLDEDKLSECDEVEEEFEDNHSRAAGTLEDTVSETNGELYPPGGPGYTDGGLGSAYNSDSSDSDMSKVLDAVAEKVQEIQKNALDILMQTSKALHSRGKLMTTKVIKHAGPNVAKTRLTINDVLMSASRGKKTEAPVAKTKNEYVTVKQKSNIDAESEPSQRQRGCPFYKKIPGTSLTVDAFRYGTIPDCKAYILTHFHYDHYGGLKKSFSQRLYCSQITGNLVKKKVGVKPEYIHTIPLNTPTIVEGVEITLLEANHCPGAVLILFKLTSGRVYLHTGDFRASTEMESYPELMGLKIHSLYLDTTYCDPQYDFPSQKEVVAFARKLVLDTLRANSKTLIVCGSYTIGKERIFRGIAEELDCKICVTRDKKSVIDCIEDRWLADRISLSWNESQLHVLPMAKLNIQGLKEHLERNGKNCSSVMGIKPTGWTHSKKRISLDHIKPETNKGNVKVYGLPYSEHSSYLEMKRFVQFTRPDKILPTVNNGNYHSRKKMEAIFETWIEEMCKPTSSSYVQPSVSRWTC